MPVFICKEIDCEAYNIRMQEIKVSYKYKEGSLVTDSRTCPICGAKREEEITNPEFIVNTTNSSKRKWRLSSKHTIY